MSNDTDKWDERFMALAEHVANWSKDPSTKVGAVIVNPQRVVIGMGYNGFPRAIEDTEERLQDRETKYELMVHAELNAILNANSSVEGCTIYTWPLAPCHECAKAILQSELYRVIALKQGNERWAYSNNIAKRMFEEAGVKVYFV